MLHYELSGRLSKAINLKLIKKCVLAFDRSAKLKGAREFSLAFVDTKTIQRLNRSYRGKDKVTDVLSFAQRDSDFVSPGEERELGEILICLAQAKSQAQENGWTTDKEICRLLIHGLAHLIGYEHEGVSLAVEKKMIKFESSVMEKLKI